MADPPVRMDPVLVKLAEWARQEPRMSREAVARRLGVSRGAVTGWFLWLEAVERGDDPPSSARTFQFAKQHPDVQSRIAAVLRQPVAVLMAESTGSTDDYTLDRHSGSLLSDLALGEGPWGRPGEQRYRVVALLELVDGVAATAIVPVRRGLDGLVYQYQVVVLVDPERDKLPIKEEIDRDLRAAGLDCYWEHGPGQPGVEIRSEGRRLELLGSLAVSALTGVRSPRSGTLADPRFSPGLQPPRLAVVVSPPYGGSRPAAALLAVDVGAGHIPAEAWIRLVHWAEDAELGSPRTLDHVRESVALDAGFVMHRVVHQLERGDIPGAWLISLETGSALDYPPLGTALIELRGLFIAMRLGPVWRRMAAWRLAGSDLDDDLNRGGAGNRRIVVSNTEPFVARTPSDAGRRGFADHRVKAAQRLAEIDELERHLDDLLARRRELGLTTHEVTLDDLGDELLCVRLRDGRYERVHGDARLADDVAFADDVVPMMREWRRAADRLSVTLVAVEPPMV
ncbi:helix-turn-helix domain-containing protein [Pseudonocardia charpentierae]|uniref:Helix-turn-helix transcriptional regulator n=1 Tax=Pseudonocardia charpentierae TaxID=3075545 RepID=A0ABU2NHZ1_9PSEU|nr:helix-turn-helix transcriptional regulator [Pseudonocardia sp. DSM 45834]MDT0353371.1 helix-turn-helix transcriptional regulator [Pseudonocardia sp. DSM 45834]